MENENCINAELYPDTDNHCPFSNKKPYRRKLLSDLLERNTKKSQDNIWNILAPSVFGILLCLICLCGTSWAWFQISRSSNVTPIQTADYAVKIWWDRQPESLPLDGKSIYKVQLTANTTYQIKIQGVGTAKTGFCKISFEGKEYITDQIDSGKEISFTVNASKASELQITTQWGTCAEQSAENKIANGGTIGENNSQQQENPEPETETTADTEQPEQNSEQETPQDTLENTEIEEQNPEQPEETTDQNQTTEQENQEEEKPEEPETEAVPETELSQDSEPTTQELENSGRAVENQEENLQPEETNPS